MIRDTSLIITTSAWPGLKAVSVNSRSTQSRTCGRLDFDSLMFYFWCFWCFSILLLAFPMVFWIISWWLGMAGMAVDIGRTTLFERWTTFSDHLRSCFHWLPKRMSRPESQQGFQTSQSPTCSSMMAFALTHGLNPINELFQKAMRRRCMKWHLKCQQISAIV